MSAERPGAEPRRRPRIKICGVTTRDDARLAVGLGAELIGLNFYPRSPRCLDLGQAAALRDEIGGRALAVGVFVNEEPERVEEIAARVGLDLLQFHGDEPPEQVARYAARAIRALHSTSAPDRDHWRDCWALLYDTPRELLASPDQYGGSGRSWPYRDLAAALERAGDQRVLLAGGVRPDNVRGILRQLPGLWGIDVCSGVETAPGVKDEALMRELFRRAETTAVVHHA